MTGITIRKRNENIRVLFGALPILCLIIFNAAQSANPIAFAVFTLPCRIDTYGSAWNGTLVYGLFEYNSTNLSQEIDTYLVFMTTDGNVRYLQDGADCGWAIKYVSSDTLMYQGSTAHFLNLATGETTDFPNVSGHHDMEYNPISNTFLTLNNYVKTVNGTRVLFDKIVEFNASGEVLWTWDTYEYVDLSEACVYNDTATYMGENVMDFTHCNTIQWDYNESIVYLNSRHLNTFYKINMSDSEVIWGCGEHGDFLLQDPNGKQVSSLWYHSHAVEQVEPGVFMMFDNDFHNETDVNDGRSRILEVTLNEQNMTASETWSWTAPKDYWSPYWGKVDRLPNGDRIGTFGTQTKHYNSSIGAVLVEVNSTGGLVRTWTFPVGWGIYRVTMGEREPSSEGFDERTAIVVVTVVAVAISVSTSAFYLRRRSRKLVNTEKRRTCLTGADRYTFFYLP
jgi:hypothetical protein